MVRKERKAYRAQPVTPDEFGDLMSSQTEPLIDDVPFPESQCRRCVHLRVVATKRGTEFLMCEEPTRPKYPPQPVVDCPVFEDVAKNRR